MNKNIVNAAVVWSLFASCCFVSSALQASREGAGKITITVKKIERVSIDKVHFWLKLENGSSGYIFLEGSNFGVLDTEQLYLEQWRPNEGWHTVVPCPDTPPPSVIKLKAGEAINQERVLTNPIHALCMERTVQFEGRFRFRMEYFMSEKDATTNEKNFGLSEHPLPAPHVAVSDPFEIPSTKK